jgi:predicted Zn-dependent protease
MTTCLTARLPTYYDEIFGLVVRLLPPNAGATHADIVRNVFKPTQGRTEPLVINGMAATHFSGVRQNAQGKVQVLEATVLTGPADAHYVLQYSARDGAALQRARNQLVEAQGSFRELTAQDRSAARSWVLKVQPFPKGGFSELAKTSPIANAEKQLRLINGYYGGGDPQVGQLVKVVSSNP